MESLEIRALTNAQLMKLGYSINPNLPLIDRPEVLRSQQTVEFRLLALHAVVACSHGFDRKMAERWLASEHLLDAVSPNERSFIHGLGEAQDFSEQAESLWALAWSLSLVPELNFEEGCDDSFVFMMPNLKIQESSSRTLRNSKLRSVDEVLQKADLAYCMHWSLVDSVFRSEKVRKNVYPYIIIERRRALDWLLSDEDWDDISLDT